MSLQFAGRVEYLATCDTRARLSLHAVHQGALLSARLRHVTVHVVVQFDGEEEALAAVRARMRACRGAMRERVRLHVARTREVRAARAARCGAAVRRDEVALEPRGRAQRARAQHAHVRVSLAQHVHGDVFAHRRLRRERALTLHALVLRAITPLPAPLPAPLLAPRAVAVVTRLADEAGVGAGVGDQVLGRVVRLVAHGAAVGGVGHGGGGGGGAEVVAGVELKLEGGRDALTTHDALLRAAV